jgi:four helix bundle protein
MPAEGSQKPEVRSQNERPPARTFSDLVVWQKAHRFVLDVYAITSEFPKEERFGLTNQMRRAAVSVPANIAEGFKKKTRPDKVRFLNISQGSLEECRYYLVLANDLGYHQTSMLMTNLQEVSKLLERYAAAILDSDS